MSEGFNKKILRGARVIKLKDQIEITIKVLKGEIPLNEEMGNEKTLLLLKGKIQGLEMVL